MVLLKFHLSELLFGNQEQAQLKDTTGLLPRELCWLVSFRIFRSCDVEIAHGRSNLQQFCFKEEGRGRAFQGGVYRWLQQDWEF